MTKDEIERNVLKLRLKEFCHTIYTSLYDIKKEASF